VDAVGFGLYSGNTPGEMGFGANNYFLKGGYSLREMYGFRLKYIKSSCALPAREPHAINTARGPHGKSQPSDRCMVQSLISLIAGCPKWTWASKEEL
jgi:hypothetical protein